VVKEECDQTDFHTIDIFNLPFWWPASISERLTKTLLYYVL